MSSDFYLPLITGDYLKKTMSLSQGEHGAYLLLLIHYWDTRSPLPKDQEELYRIARASTEGERKNVDKILCKFFKQNRRGFVQKTMEEIIKKANDLRAKRAEAGRKGGKKTAKQLQSKCLSKRGSKTQAIQRHKQTRTPLTPLGGGVGQYAHRFKELYPKKTRMDDALEHWREKNLEEEGYAIIHAVKTLANAEQWTKKNGHYVPKPLKFLEERQWESVPPDPRQKRAAALLAAPYIRHTGKGKTWPSSEWSWEPDGPKPQALKHQDGFYSLFTSLEPADSPEKENVK